MGPLPEAPTHDMPAPAAASASATRVPVAAGTSGGGAAKSKKEDDDLKELAEWAQWLADFVLAEIKRSQYVMNLSANKIVQWSFTVYRCWLSSS